MRTIKIENGDEIKDLIEKKGVIVTKGRELSQQKEEIETELNKCGLQINKLNDKLIPMVEGLGVELGEFEQIESIKVEEGELVMSIFDQVEEFKNQLRKMAEEKKTIIDQNNENMEQDIEKVKELLDNQ